MATILVIDDDAANRQLLETLLSYQHHRVLLAPDAQAGLAIAQTERPHLIITDVVMHAMDGFEFVQELRRTQGIGATPVIVYSGTYRRGDARPLLDAAGVTFLEKPTHPKALLETIEKALVTSGQPAPSIPTEVFAQEHRRVLADRLTRQVEELEEVNARLENEIIERAQAENALREATEFNRQIVASAGEGIVVYDRDLRYVVWNPFMEYWSGKTAAEVVGRFPWEVFPFLKTVDIEAGLRRALTGETVALPDILNPVDLDGEPHWATTILFPFRDCSGAIIGAINVIHDITERKLAEETLRQSEARFRTLVENNNDAISLCDADGTIRYMSPTVKRILGSTPEEMVGICLFDLIHFEDRAGAQAAQEEVLARSGSSATHQRRVRHKDGSWRWIEATITNLLHDPQIGAVVRNFRDITERKQAEERLRANAVLLQVLSRQLLETQENERRNLARELHDEIGQTLSAISINLQMISECTPEAAQRRVQDSIRIVDRALAQVRNLSLDLRPSILDDLGLGAALEWLVDRQKERTGWVVHFHYALPDKPRLPANIETAFFRVAQEALTNIMRHGHAKEVWLEVTRDEHAIHLTVRDDGVGFDVDVCRQRAIRGGSLGLLGMEERIELLGGEIAITSESGKGTTIHVSAPLEVSVGRSAHETDPSSAG